MERLKDSDLSPLQRRIVNVIANSTGDVAVVGGPGTGKTVLAMAGFGRDENRKQILLTYSNPLSRMIGEGQSIKADTVHHFCYDIGKEIESILREFEKEYVHFLPDGQKVEENDLLNRVVIREYGYEYGCDSGGSASWPKWDKLTKAYERLDGANRDKIRYNDIFIDEGQDLPNEAYKFFKLISDRVIVTFDEAQEVGADKGAKSSLFRGTALECNRVLNELSLQDTFYDLIDNFRNTPEIERVAKLFYNNYGSNGRSLFDVAVKEESGNKPKVLFSDLNEKLLFDIMDYSYQNNRRVGVFIPDRDSFNKAHDLFLKSLACNELSGTPKYFYKCGESENKYLRK